MRRASVALALGLAACASDPQPLPAEGQLVVYLDTDAIVPRSAAGAYGALDPYPLFDHVRFDLVSDEPCDCTRDFDVDAAKINAGQISFGVLPSPGRSGSLRVRLYRYTDTESDEPRTETTIDVTFAIDAIAAEGVSERTVFLKTEDVGAPRGQSDPLPMIEGRPPTFHAGTWALGARVDCPAPPRDGPPRDEEVCVPGGAFWMGNPLEARRSDKSGMQRLAVLSPFYMLASEVTVAAYRKQGLPATPWGGHGAGITREDYCTFTAEPGAFETYPINCVSFASAREYCRRNGGDLPTEAQYEYVAGALRSAPFVWGSDPPTCEGVVMCKQGPFGGIVGDATCTEIGTRGGPMPVGSGALDRFVLPTGTVIDLIGNVSEFMRDAWARLVEPCWSRPGLYVNPICLQAGTLDPQPAFSLRGGEWEGTPNRAAGRFYTLRGDETLGPVFTGFRCVRDAK